MNSFNLINVRNDNVILTATVTYKDDSQSSGYIHLDEFNFDTSKFSTIMYMEEFNSDVKKYELIAEALKLASIYFK